jgi:hypothetical protein
MVRALGDMLKDFVEELGYSSNIQQKLFGNIPHMKQFIETTQGEITIQPQLSLVAPLSASIYPFEIYVKYKSTPNGMLLPIFGKQLKHYESIERVTEKGYESLTKDGLNDRFAKLAQHRKIKMEMLYGRDAVVNLRVH